MTTGRRDRDLGVEVVVKARENTHDSQGSSEEEGVQEDEVERGALGGAVTEGGYPRTTLSAPRAGEGEGRREMEKAGVTEKTKTKNSERRENTVHGVQKENEEKSDKREERGQVDPPVDRCRKMNGRL